MSGYGQSQAELGALQGMTPEDRRALVRGEYMPERLAEFNRSRDAQERMLRGQIDQAYQVANTPIEVRGDTPAASMASLVANALRTFGGFAMGRTREKQLADAQAESKRQHDELMGMGESATGAGLSTKQRGLTDALRGYSGGYGE